MKNKAISLACVMCLSASLMTACGQNNDNGTTGANNATGYSQQNRNPLSGGNGGFLGTGIGSNRGGDDRTGMSGGNGAGGTGTSGLGMMGANRGTGDRAGTNGGIGGTGTVQGSADGVHGISGLIRDEDTFVIGNHVFVSGGNAKSGKRDGDQGQYARALSVYLGPDMHVMQVTDPKAVQALKRVKAGMNGGSKNIGKLSKDLELLFQSGKPVESGANPTGTRK